MPALLPILLVIIASIVSVGSIIFSTIKSHIPSQPQVQESPSPELSLTPSPSPSPTPTPTSTQKPSAAPSPSPKPASTGQTTSSGNFTVLTYNLGSTTVVTDTANDDDCGNNCPVKPVSQYVSDNGGHAGMNGTYFCPQDYSSCSGKVNSFDFAVWNNRKKKWINASTLFWNGRGMFVFRPGSAQFYANQNSVGAPSDITGGITNYPSLIAGGKIIVDEGSLTEKQNAKNTKSAIGAGNGKLFLVESGSASMLDMANYLLSLGATDGLNLDGGGSVALYDGGYKVGPGRNLPNAVIIK